MKFMRLGSKTDIFETVGNTRSAKSDIPSDITVIVNGMTFHLHKFPLFSKSAKLQRLAATKALEGNEDPLELSDFPGGVETFELCVKFSYGITVTLNAYNVVAVRCAAEHLEMTETTDKGNLMFKVDVFLSTYIFNGWKDSIIALKSTRTMQPWAEELQLTSRCIDAIACKVLVNPSKVDWSYTYTQTGKALQQKSSEITHSPPRNGFQGRKKQSAHDDWWIEDLAELSIDLYWRVFLAIKSKGRIPYKVLGAALHFYALKWILQVRNDKRITEVDETTAAKDRHLLEKIATLLPPDKGCISGSFLLKLLKAAVLLGASISIRKELTRRAGLQLEEASVNDLLIPSVSRPCNTYYDMDLVQSIVEHFMMQDQSPPVSPTRVQRPPQKRRTRSAEHVHFADSRRSTSATHSAKLRVAKLIDGYLAEVARDPHLDISKFMALAKSIPDFSRPVHDGLYKAIDVLLKEHPEISKSERKRICRILDCKKLSMEACMEAAQNEQLPLRVVVQVLFFEQVRASIAGGVLLTELPNNVKAMLAVPESESREGTSCILDEKWDEVQQNFEALQKDLANMKVKIAEVGKEQSAVEQEIAKGTIASSRTKKFFSKLWTGKLATDTAKSCCP